MANMASITEGALNLRRVVLLLMTMGMALLLASGVAHAASQIDQQQTDISSGNYSMADYFWPVAQTFTAGMTGELHKVSVYVGCCPGGKPPGYLRIYVYNVDGSGRPDSSNLLAFGSASQYGFSNNGAMSWRDIALGQAVKVNAGTKYALVMASTTSNACSGCSLSLFHTASNSYLWGTTSTDLYTGGEQLWFNRNTSTWDAPGNDLTFKTHVNPVPANDNFANAQQITGTEATLTGTNVAATKESSEPNHVGYRGGKSVWYEWTPQNSGKTTIDTFGSNFDTLLAVYTGSAVNGLTKVASNDDEDRFNHVLTSKMSFTATAGATYRMAVDGMGGQSGNINLHLTPPPPPVITSPADGTYDNDGSFTISGTAEPNSSVELFDGGNSLNKAAAVSAEGNWFFELSNVSEGSHSYTVKVSDQAGNTSAPSSTRTVIVDTTKPKVSGVDPAENATAVVPDANVTATFSEAMKASTINTTTFKLFKEGSTTITASVSYDPIAKKATLNPYPFTHDYLEPEVTYKAVVTTGAKDLAGNVLDQNPTLTGNQQKVWYFKVILDPTEL